MKSARVAAAIPDYLSNLVLRPIQAQDTPTDSTREQ